MKTKDKLKAVIDYSGMSKKDFAQTVGMSNTYLSEILNGHKKLNNLQRMRDIGKVFNLDYTTSLELLLDSYTLYNTRDKIFTLLIEANQ